MWHYCHLILVQFHLCAVHLRLHLALGTYHYCIDRYVGRADLRKLLYAIHDGYLVVKIAQLDNIIVGQCLKCNLFLLFHVAKVVIILKK